MISRCVCALTRVSASTRLATVSSDSSRSHGVKVNEARIEERMMKPTTSNITSLPQHVNRFGNALAPAPGTSAARTFDLRQGRPIRLTPREVEVLSLLCEGLPNKLISRRLDISAATVKCHISRILTELGVSSRLQAVVAASRCGLLDEHRDSSSENNDRESGRGLTAVRLAGGRGFIAAAA
jgi:DNA-binding NarL/FixJ family response regulator